MEKLLDVLLDEENIDNILLQGEDGTEYEFEQVATIPYNDDWFAILAPAKKDDEEDAEDDEAIVFRLVDKDGVQSLVIEDNEEVAMDVFNEYVKLYDEQEECCEDHDGCCDDDCSCHDGCSCGDHCSCDED